MYFLCVRGSAALGLHCRVACSSCGEQELLCAVAHRLRTAAASLLAERGL